MRGAESTYHHSYTSLTFLLVLSLFHTTFSVDVNTLSSTESLTISSNRTLVSPGGLFELGFFKPSDRSLRWYIGIWYKKASEKTYAWVANRDNPLPNSIGTLKISGNNLVLLDYFNTAVWSTNLTRGNARSSPHVVAELLANGNFVMRSSNSNGSPSGFLWQSFDFPTDTLLPEMKLGYDRKTGRSRFLRSWRSLDDPSSGEYTYALDPGRALPEFFLKGKGLEIQRSGPWNGIEFTGIPKKDPGVNYMVDNYTDNGEKVTYTFLIANQSIHSSLALGSNGFLYLSTWILLSSGWTAFHTLPTEPYYYAPYNLCGPNAYSDPVTTLCNCFEGFDRINHRRWDWTDLPRGCARRTPLSCSGGNRFSTFQHMKLPDTKKAVVDRGIDLNNCKEKCRSDCFCTSFAAADVRNGGTGCVMWTGELIDTLNYSTGGQDLYVKMAAVVLSSDEERDKNGKIIGWSIGLTLTLFLSATVFCFWKGRQKQAKAAATQLVKREVLMSEVVLPRQRNLFEENEIEDLELPVMEFEAVLTATEHFSDCNKVGKGGFGAVYKGRLLDGQEIAVKRLSETSAQGNNEFMNEVRVIARLQHINLVRLLGCCVDQGEKILIYEYLENLSLDSHLFSLTRSCMLNWKMRFDIINGIARGLLYLHQDSCIRIIHRDLKASNVLLDKDMTPKIADFGMARIFGRDETEANTIKVVGTYGYIAPEYLLDGIFSIKSDVFSFGVLLLEIISGKRNRGFHNSGRDRDLLECVWRNWKEGRGLEIVDTDIIDSSSPTFRPREIIRCLQIGLLCVQALADDRPPMSVVVVMLGSETEDIPHPKPPGCCVTGNSRETYSTWSNRDDLEGCTVNQITMSIIDAR